MIIVATVMKYFGIGIVFLSAVFGLAGCSADLETTSTSVAETATVPSPDIQAEDSQVLAVVKQYTDAIKSGDKKAAAEVLFYPRPPKRRVEDVDVSKLQASNPPPWFEYLVESKFRAEETRVRERTPDRFNVRSVGSFHGSDDIYWIVDFEVIQDSGINQWRIKEISPQPGGLRSLDESKKEMPDPI